MLPQTVGELRNLIQGLPDSMPFTVDVNGDIGSVDSTKLEVDNRQVGWDGTKCQPRKADVLVLTVEVDC